MLLFCRAEPGFTVADDPMHAARFRVACCNTSGYGQAQKEDGKDRVFNRADGCVGSVDRCNGRNVAAVDHVHLAFRWRGGRYLALLPLYLPARGTIHRAVAQSRKDRPSCVQVLEQAQRLLLYCSAIRCAASGRGRNHLRKPAGRRKVGPRRNAFRHRVERKRGFWTHIACLGFCQKKTRGFLFL